jgi:phenylacetate-CoA ligase
VSCYYPLLLEAVSWHGIRLAFRADRADWMTVASQRQGGFTVPSWSSFLGCATAKVNLDPSGWRAEEHRRRFLEQNDAQVVTGDPISLSHLADLDAELHPKALISTALHLTAATKARLEARFDCPVIDVYSLTETGPIAATRPAGGMALLQPRLFVEITDADGSTCEPRTPGTITVSGGMNPYLPLLRYRTGDSGQLVWSGNQPVLERLSGRGAVLLTAADGSRVNSFDITQLFEELPLRRWAVHQGPDTSIVVSREAEVGSTQLDEQVVAAIHTALGEVPVTIDDLTADDKVTPFTIEESG